MNETNELGVLTGITPVQRGIKLVLNGGKDTIDNPTMPMQWFFEPEVAAQRPTHILFIDQDQEDIESRYNETVGNRYLVKVGQVVSFMPLYKPGRHRIIAIALTSYRYEDDDRKVSSDDFVHLLQGDRNGRYRHEIDLKALAPDPKRGEDEDQEDEMDLYRLIEGRGAIAATIVDIEVPAELFAEKPRGPIGRFVWNWINRWHTEPPRDQCRYRARALWAFTAQPPLFVVGHVLKYIAAFFSSILLPLGRIGVLFFGYRPPALWRGLGGLWQWKFSTDNYEEAFQWRLYGRHSFRQWKSYRDSKDRRDHYMPITPFEAVLVMAVLLGLWWKVVVISAAIGAGLLLLALILWRYPIRWRSKAPTPKPIVKDTRYRDWLIRTLVASEAPSKVDLKRLPRSYSGSLVQRFRVGFWATKMKVCRPYAGR